MNGDGLSVIYVTQNLLYLLLYLLSLRGTFVPYVCLLYSPRRLFFTSLRAPLSKMNALTLLIPFIGLNS